MPTPAGDDAELDRSMEARAPAVAEERQALTGGIVGRPVISDDANKSLQEVNRDIQQIKVDMVDVEMEHVCAVPRPMAHPATCPLFIKALPLTWYPGNGSAQRPRALSHLRHEART